MKEINGKLIERIKRTDRVESFAFQLDETIDFIPGQFLQVIFGEKDRSNKALNKYLSFSNAPGKDHIEVTKKISDSEFSKKLSALKNGDSVLFKGPMGNCVFKGEFGKVGFLVGGIGITPVISTLEYISEKRLKTDVKVLYSNWTEKDIAFRSELDKWSENNKNIEILHALVECKLDDTKCFSGMITKDLVVKSMPDYLARHLFIFGPPGMVSAMKSICDELGCEKDMVKMENFVGY